WYQLAGSKSTATAQKILGSYRGTLVVDGYQVYPKLRKSCGNAMQIAHCWAHADRKFKDAKDPPAAIAEIRGLIHRLYEIEREVEGTFPGDTEAQTRRAELRRARSAEVVREIRAWAFTQGGQKRSSFGKAVRYLLKYWDGLTCFLDDPRVPLDNNAAERALRGVVLGRKNFFGTRSKRGAHIASILYSLIGTAHLHGVQPDGYLRRAALAAIERPGTVTLAS
ncbi:MAG: IS66 family transposase, partial [Acidobacteriota bacterium]